MARPTLSSRRDGMRGLRLDCPHRGSSMIVVFVQVPVQMAAIRRGGPRIMCEMTSTTGVRVARIPILEGGSIGQSASRRSASGDTAILVMMILLVLS